MIYYLGICDFIDESEVRAVNMQNVKTGLQELYNAVEAFGSAWLRIHLAVFSAVFNFIKRPVLFVARAVFSLVKSLWKYFAAVLREQTGNEKYFTGRLWRALKNLGITAVKRPRSFFSVLWYYIKKGAKQYRSLFKFILRLAVPAGAAAVMFLTIGWFADAEIALRIDCGGTTLGYVSSESDYLEAKNLAKERLGLNSDNSENSADMLPSVTYSLALIKINQYTGADTLCDRLIESSDSSIVNACGIYIDGQFLCSVKNEAAAKRVFNAILEEYAENNDDGMVSFVQDIDYVEGLYPDVDSVMWESDELSRVINAIRSNDTYHTVRPGESFSSIADEYGLSIEQLLALNPGHTYSYTLYEGERILVSDADSFLTVKVVKTEIHHEDVPYEVIEIESDALYRGTTRVAVEGEDGVDQVTSIITYVDGIKVSESEVARLTIKEPVDERIQVGTRATDSSYVIPGGVFLWPAVNCDNINSEYGYRWGKLHSGIDIGSSVGTSLGKLVVASADGVVAVAGVHSSYGYYVRIQHSNGIETLYAHCLANSLMVSVGDKVTAGQPIARVGETGYATGPHLHYEVIINGVRVDPGPYLGLR